MNDLKNELNLILDELIKFYTMFIGVKYLKCYNDYLMQIDCVIGKLTILINSLN